MNNLVKSQAYNYSVDHVQHDNTCLALHSWIPKNIKHVLYYIHGIQSHGGWLYETGPSLAKHSIAVFVLDRRGSGRSEGIRGDLPNAATLFNDHKYVLSLVASKYKDLPLILLGQSLGGSILAGLLAWSGFDISYDGVIFTAPALGQMHYRYTDRQREAISKEHITQNFTLRLRDEDYTRREKYLNFIKQDPLCVRSITRRTRASLLDIENNYWEQNSILKDIPSLFIYPKKDKIINMKMALNVYKRLSRDEGTIIKLPANDHYLEFSKMRDDYINWIANFISNIEKR